ncbi:unnamed protein product [Cylicocyclus nassatus]|uniref:Apple domain-containing protein n=1 Tax=Cylicocyclus nassatus TaxID=53992 RepID=A0AA36GWQ5_CYLNA|nr:unnamed protein product [Cylicocyclus nassatus]
MMLTRFSLIVMLAIGFAIPELTPPQEWVRKCTDKLVNNTWKSVGCKVFATSSCPSELLATEQVMCASPYTFTKIKRVEGVKILTIIDGEEGMCFAECYLNERCIAVDYQKNTLCYLYAAVSEKPDTYGPRGTLYRLNRDPMYLPKSVAIPML